jgi:hypothetical protein
MMHVSPPLDLRGRRTRQTELLISERDKLLVEAAKFFPGCSDREIARRLRSALSIYRAGRFRRDRNDTCPKQYRGTLTELLYLLLRVHDHVPSEMTIRRALGVVVIQRRCFNRTSDDGAADA